MTQIWFNTEIVGRILGVSGRTISSYCRSGMLPNAFKAEDGSWLIPDGDIIAYQETIADTWGGREVADFLGFQSTNPIAGFCQDGTFPNAFKLCGQWRIPDADVKAHIETNQPRCKLCGILTTGGLCEDCIRETSGQGHRFYDTHCLTSSWGHMCNQGSTVDRFWC